MAAHAPDHPADRPAAGELAGLPERAERGGMKKGGKKQYDTQPTTDNDTTGA